MDWDKPLACFCLEALIFPCGSDVEAPDTINLLYIVAVELAGFIRTQSVVSPYHGDEHAPRLLLLGPYIELFKLWICVTGSDVDLFDPLQLQAFKNVCCLLCVISKPTKQQTQFLNVLIDCGRRLARTQQPSFELDRIGLAVLRQTLITNVFNKGVDVVLLVLGLFGSP